MVPIRFFTVSQTFPTRMDLITFNKTKIFNFPESFIIPYNNLQIMIIPYNNLQIMMMMMMMEDEDMTFWQIGLGLD
jgi:hypothetical protein